MRRGVAAKLGLALSLATGIAFAQSFPVKPVRIVSPYPPGGGNDTLARTLAPKLGEHNAEVLAEWLSWLPSPSMERGGG